MEENKDLMIRRKDNTAVGMFPEDAEGVYKISIHLAKSDLCPKSFGQNPANVFAAIMMGRELGIGAMQAMSNIAVVNGRASVWGELVVGLIRSSGRCAKLTKKVTGEGDKLSVTVIGRRPGDTEDTEETFTWDDAKRAGLTGKDTYQKYPKDMLYWKALNRLAKQLWGDVLKGMNIREVAEEMAEEFVGAVEVEADKPEPKVPTPAEPTAEELLKKAEDAKARVAAEEAKERAKVEKKAKAEKPNPVPSVAEGVPAATEEEMAEEPAAEAVPVNRSVGTMMGAFKLSDTKTAAPIGFCIKVQTADGEQKFKVASHEEATSYKALKDKTVQVIWEKLVPALDGIVGNCVSCEGTSK